MLSIIFSIVSAVIAIFTITNLLNWFITIPFHLPEISYAGAFGICLIVAYFRKRVAYKNSKDHTEAKEMNDYSLYVVLINLLLLAFGYAVKYFLM